MSRAFNAILVPPEDLLQGMILPPSLLLCEDIDPDDRKLATAMMYMVMHGYTTTFIRWRSDVTSYMGLDVLCDEGYRRTSYSRRWASNTTKSNRDLYNEWTVE
jgi:hypothetical protein